MLGYVLISLSAAANEKDVLDRITDFNEVSKAHLLFGEWDILVHAKVESPELLTTFVLDNIRSMQEVKMTSTLIVAK